MRKKKSMVVVTFTLEEIRMVRNIILDFRNQVIQRGGPTEDLDALLAKLL